MHSCVITILVFCVGSLVFLYVGDLNFKRPPNQIDWISKCVIGSTIEKYKPFFHYGQYSPFWGGGGYNSVIWFIQKYNKDCFIINAMNLNGDIGTNILCGSKKFVPLKMYILLAFQRGTAQ